MRTHLPGASGVGARIADLDERCYSGFEIATASADTSRRC